MKFLLFVVVIALGQSDAGSAAGCTYRISAARTEQIIPSVSRGRPPIELPSNVLPTQNITFNRGLNPADPLKLDFYVVRGDNFEPVYDTYSQDLISTCDTAQNNTWNYVATELIKRGIIPGGGCSVEPGTYTINAAVPTVLATFPNKLKCGEYRLYINGHAGGKVVVALTMAFRLFKGGNRWTVLGKN